LVVFKSFDFKLRDYEPSDLLVYKLLESYRDSILDRESAVSGSSVIKVIFSSISFKFTNFTKSSSRFNGTLLFIGLNSIDP